MRFRRQVCQALTSDSAHVAPCPCRRMVLSSLRESTCSSPTQPVQLDAPTSGESEAGITGFLSVRTRRGSLLQPAVGPPAHLRPCTACTLPLAAWLACSPLMKRSLVLRSGFWPPSTALHQGNFSVYCFRFAWTHELQPWRGSYAATVLQLCWQVQRWRQLCKRHAVLCAAQCSSRLDDLPDQLKRGSKLFLS